MPETTLIDLRSDTVTRPSAGMRNAIANAPVGDDQYGDDPSVNALQERMAHELGKEAALWVPTGTMANQIALKVFTQPGDDVIVSRESHAVWHETGGSAANAGVHMTELGTDGTFTLDAFLNAIKPQNHFLYPPTTLVEIENTQNRMGGIVFPQDEAIRICHAAKQHNISTYLDGARLWNAALVTNQSIKDLAAPFDMVMVAFSKGLAAPGGSLLAGTKQHITQAVRYRRMLGGAMRQAGLFAAAATYALDNNIPQLKTDHDNAKHLANILNESPNITLVAQPQTNIIVFNTKNAHQIAQQAKEQNVLLNALSDTSIRLVTHCDVSKEQCEQAGEILVNLANPA